MLHGWFGDGHAFAPIESALTGGEFTYAFIDYRGYGGMKDVRGDGFTHQQVFVRLRGTGLFDDPNDFATLMVVAVLFCSYWIIDGSRFPPV